MARYSRRKRKTIAEWPETGPTPQEVAEKATYVGSPEHKTNAAVFGLPTLHSDKAKCDPSITPAQADEALKRFIRKRCVSGVFQGGFPKYVWGYVEAVAYEARHINGPQGTYKAYPITSAQMPRDPLKRLTGP